MAAESVAPKARALKRLIGSILRNPMNFSESLLIVVLRKGANAATYDDDDEMDRL